MIGYTKHKDDHTFSRSFQGWSAGAGCPSIHMPLRRGYSSKRLGLN